MSDMITCGGCPTRWTAPNAAHCGKCHRLFATVSLFDKHRDQRGEHGTCLDPADCTMRYRDGMWHGPEMRAGVRDALRGQTEVTL